MSEQMMRAVRAPLSWSGGTVGFVGTGVMGQPMALNLLRAATPLVVWNRTRTRTDQLAQAGATVVDRPGDVFGQAQTVIVMLVTSDVIDDVLGRGTPGFEAMVRGHTVVSMATTSPDYSRSLSEDLQAAGARYVEAPVSGQRPVAEAGRLVTMLAGHPEALAEVTPLLRLMCRTAFDCGPVPNGLLMKLAVNLVTGAAMTAMAEGMTYARSQGLDASQFAAVLEASPLASDFLRMKAPKLAKQDFRVQGALGVARKDLSIIA